MSNVEQQEQATIRRAPKLAMFLAVGGVVGAVVTFVLTAAFPFDETVGFGALFGYFLLYGVPAGVVLGGVVGLIFDARSRRHATSVSVEHETVIERELEADVEPAFDVEAVREVDEVAESDGMPPGEVGESDGETDRMSGRASEVASNPTTHVEGEVEANPTLDAES